MFPDESAIELIVTSQTDGSRRTQKDVGTNHRSDSHVIAVGTNHRPDSRVLDTGTRSEGSGQEPAGHSMFEDVRNSPPLLRLL